MFTTRHRRRSLVAVDFEFSASPRAPMFRARFDTKAADRASDALRFLSRLEQSYSHRGVLKIMTHL
jgi:hypothetical protein